MTLGLSERDQIHPGLHATRSAVAAWTESPPDLLGGLCWGELPRAAHGLASMPVVPLGARVIDSWSAAAGCDRGSDGHVHWRADGRWLFGQLEIETASADLSEAARSAYLELFGALDRARYPCLLRLWNYVPRINEIEQGLERYRRFNVGRQQAFVDAGRDAFEGAPAACAVGAAGSRLAIRFLAAREPAIPVENPRQVSAYRYSPAFGPRSPTFSRAALADAGAGRVALWISGTASIVGEASMHAGDPQAQLAETLRNLEAVIDSANARGAARFAPSDFDWVAYLRDPAHLPLIEQRLAAWGGSIVPVRADICRAELLVEIEGHAITAGTLVR
jgi:hypothetical protein